MSDPINPQHYKRDGIECIEAIKAALVDGFQDYLRGNVLKYLWRYKERNGIEDLRKARQYLEWLIEESEVLAEASGESETPSETPTKTVGIPKGFIEEFIGLLREPIKSPPKRYREPTQADLRDGPIKCDYRDNDHEQWRSGFLVYILNGSMPYLCTDKSEQFSGQWEQCQIEVAE